MFQIYEREPSGAERLMDEFPESYPTYANERLKNLRDSFPAKTFSMRKARDETEDDSWKDRERARFNDGTYKRLPWDSDFTPKPDWIKKSAELFAHVSTDDPAKIAYTASPEHGRQDRQTRIRPGRFLEMVGCANITYWCTWYARENETIEVKFAETADEIEHVYTHGPSSCMSREADHYESHCHPVRAYAAGDLSVAYIRNADGISARAICWRERKIYSRIYGDKGRLEPALRALGFEHWTPKNSFEGARLLKIPDGNNWVMPYLDGIQSVDDCGDFFRIAPDGKYDATETNGLLREIYDHCAHCEDPIYSSLDAYDVSGESWCQSCYEHCTIRCYHCEEDFDLGTEGVSDSRDNWYCAGCAEDQLFYCKDCNEHYSHDRYTSYELKDSSIVCENCAHLKPTSPTVFDERQGDLLARTAA